MKSLAHCLAKLGLEEHEAAILRGKVEGLQEQGHTDAHNAARVALGNHLDNLHAMRADVLRQAGYPEAAMPGDSKSMLPAAGVSAGASGETAPLKGVVDRGAADAKANPDSVDAQAGEVKSVSGGDVKRDDGVSGAHSNAIPLESVSDGTVAHAELQADLSKAHPGLVKGFGALNVEAQRDVMLRVGAAIHDDKVFDAVVHAVPVDVMHDFVRREGATDSALGDKAVLEDLLVSSDPKAPVTARFVDAVVGAGHDKILPVESNADVPAREAKPQSAAARKRGEAKIRESRLNAPADELGIKAGDTIKLSRDHDYIPADTPMKVEEVRGGNVYVKDEKDGGSTSTKASILLAEHQRKPLVTVEKPKAADESLEARRVKLLDSMKGRTLFDEYAKLGRETGTAQQGIADAKDLTGLHLLLETEGRDDLPVNVPMRFDPRTRIIEFNNGFVMTRGEAAQYAAEELLHAVDVTTHNRSLSASSKRFEPSGDLHQEAQKHVDGGREYAAFLKYPLDPGHGLTQSRMSAELFARLGALYFGEPARMRQSLPKAYEAFHGIFQVGEAGVGGQVSRKIWLASGGDSTSRGESGRARQSVRRDEVGAGQQQTAELGRLRDAIREAFGASREGRVVQGKLESRRAPADAGVLHDGGEKEPPRERPPSGDDGMGAGDFRQRVTDRIHDMVQSHGTFNTWHKTVGTQYHKAEVDSDYKRVFKKARAFEEDTSQFAMNAADKAPSLLPRMQNLGDALPDFLKSAEKRGASASDVKAVGQVMHNATLAAHRLTDAEVKALPEKQQKVYGEVRGAIDKSLDDLAASEAYRMMRNYDVAPEVRDEAKANPEKASAIYVKSLDPWADRLRETYKSAIKDRDEALAYHDDVETRELDTLNPVERASRSKELTRKREGIVTDSAQRIQKAEDALGRVEGLKGEVRDIFKRVGKLKSDGYVPLMRYGKHTVYSPDAGEHGFFSMHESQAEANAMARSLHAEFPEAEVTQGIRSEKDHELTAGMTPDAMEVFAHAIGADKADVFQEFLKMSVSQRSVLKRLIHRKGTPGFGDDVQRNLASFVTSNAKSAARNYHFADMLEAAANIPKSKGDVKDEAVKLINYIRNPQKEAPGLRALMFMNYLGGSVASALTNATQPIMQTMPYLAKYGGGVAELRKAMVIGAGGKIHDAGLHAAMARADKEGVTAPHEIHQLYAESIRGINSSVGFRKFSKVWGSFFSMAEQFNRKITFAAAYNLAKDWKPEQFSRTGTKDAYTFATKAVEETQGVYSRSNRPNWARGALGSTLMTFKQFSIGYLEFLKRLPPQQRAVALTTLVAASGVQGLPFAQDIEDILDTIGQSLGYNTNTKEALKNLATKTLGKAVGDFALRGVTAIPGSPIDMQARLGLGNLIPGTALLKHSEKDKTKDIAEFFGPAGSTFQTALTAQDRIQAGDYKGAGKQLLPVAVQNLLKGMDMAQSGQYKNDKGQKIVDADKVDALFKAIGLSPYAVGKANQNVEGVRQDIAMQKQVQADITSQWAAAKADGDEDGVQKARQAMQEWNKKNEDSKIVINPATIAHRIREMKLERDVRLGKSAPKTMRTQVQSELRGE